jgi:hypothetical protein
MKPNRKIYRKKVAILQAELTGQEEQTMNLDRFLAIVKKYTEIEELTPTILNEFVERIIVHAPNKSTGKRVQQLKIKRNGQQNGIAKMTMPLAVTILLYWGPPKSAFLFFSFPNAEILNLPHHIRQRRSGFPRRPGRVLVLGFLFPNSVPCSDFLMNLSVSRYPFLP